MIKYLFLVMDKAYAVFFKCYTYTLFNVVKTVLRCKNVVIRRCNFFTIKFFQRKSHFLFECCPVEIV